MARLTCPACPRHRGPGKYLCQVCWAALPATTRLRLSARDSRAFARLRELHGQIAAHKPLPDIEVSR
ncbi:hypothetical protein PYK79_50065 [Streptomyces sp. ID05-04B]|uniref:hypothetical protein n=1 Tax=Streptomyces sp. ID05-04B TaxID=3028661 RepID=UPI0029C27B8F|nr:hypothetical protein [Streptomyces sp. ID05-04B]MDX5569827.1 hypothetical protein [Streptomyces sp. ID05-04B]